MDSKVIKAVLVASGGQVEPAFNALLGTKIHLTPAPSFHYLRRDKNAHVHNVGMSDPNFKEEEETPPAQPPRPTTQQLQEQEDERLARQMYAHERAAMERATQRQRQQEQPYNADSSSEPDYSFEGLFRLRLPTSSFLSGNAEPSLRERVVADQMCYSDDFAAFRENVKQGFNTTQTKFNKWMTDFRKRLDGDEEERRGEDEIGPGPASAIAQQQQQPPPQRHNFGPSQREQLYGISKTAERNAARRSTDQDRYDADPKVLGDDFAELELRDEGTPSPFRFPKDIPIKGKRNER